MKGINCTKNQIAYIFGGSVGIGLSIAKQLVQEECHVVIFARTEAKLIAATKEIESCRQQESTNVNYRTLDVSDNEQVNLVIEDCISKYGTPNLLINCVGRAHPRRFSDIPYEQLDQTMKVNFYGIWNTCSALIPHMKKKGGWVLNTSSMVGFMGVYGYADYAASKFAIMGFSETLRSEMKQHNIGVSVLCPPDTDTPGFETENLTKPEETRMISKGAKIMSADAVARIALKGMKKGKKVIVPGFDGKFAYWMKRHFPFIVEMVMQKSINKAQKNGK